MKNKLLFAVLFLSSMAFGQHGLHFNWNQSATPGVTGNRLTCGTVSKVYTFSWNFNTPTTAFDWLTTDTVNLPTQGKQYFCAVTASNGIESDYSSEVIVTFPLVPVPPQSLQAKPF